MQITLEFFKRDRFIYIYQLSLDVNLSGEGIIQYTAIRVQYILIQYI